MKDSGIVVSKILFDVRLPVNKTDRVELDFQCKKAMVVNKHGKVKMSTDFKYWSTYEPGVTTGER